MTTFTPSVWKAEGVNVQSTADDFYRAAHGVVVGQPIDKRTSSPIEAAAAAGDALCQNPWHHLIAKAHEGLTSVGSRMIGTGDDYEAEEESAAAQRFWD
ncbi:MAG: hypothetical protein GX596_07105 [Propionibacterium sp.]|nr:hypothetical protein [Propionibacterium sp.]